ncbi:glycine reductase [Tissierella praeacuta DSM 18095]|uniref:Glycine reductase n=2 Tax=Tissierella praeacuta TaxID=43131 RepID=A0A1M4Y5F0_9FIRM|nr:glycine reductase [Tissierella praeacuta]SHF01047.1 glycine reductase [Tissierella praeacuta DSM 18095]SUO98840.1 Betaine reductase complex component B subunit beta [Tissierella praeacuta]
MKKAIHYINQFFAGIGGEDTADYRPEIREGLVGPSLALNSMLDAEVTHTIICGDNFMGSNTDEAVETILGFLEDKEFDIFVAGPAFQAGRYGVACGTICKAVKEKFNVPVITSMNEENPGVEMFKKDIYIFQGGKSAAKLRDDVKAMANFANKILKGEKTGSADEEGFFSRGIRAQIWLKSGKTAAERGVDMLVKKLKGEPFETELPIPKQDRVPIASPIRDLSKSNIAMVTTGGIVPVDNPDRIQSASATRWGKYDISKVDRLESGVYKTIHAGFDPAAADADPNVIMPIDVMKAYLKEGKIGKLHDYFYSTVGTGTTQAEAARMGKEIVEKLKEDNVDGVIMTST